MKNESTWQPSKYELVGGQLRGSRDPKEVAVSSRLHVDLVAAGLQQALLAHGRGRLLDLGCGKVPLYALYRPLASSITCADWPNSFHPLAHIDQPCDLLQPLPFDDGSFDTIVLTDVIEHIPTPQNLLRELQRILATGGSVVGSVPFLYRLHEEPYDYFRYTAHALQRLAGEAGLQVTLLRPYGAGLDVVCDLLAKLAVDWHWRFGPWLADKVQRLGAWLRRGRFAERLVGRHADMPLGYVFVLTRAPAGA